MTPETASGTPVEVSLPPPGDETIADWLQQRARLTLPQLPSLTITRRGYSGFVDKAAIPSATTIPVRGSAQNGWAPVTCAGQNGWISSQYLRTP